MARISFVSARRAASRRARNTRAAYVRRWLRFRRRVRALGLDAEDRAILVVWTIRALAIIATASTLGLSVRLFGITSGLF